MATAKRAAATRRLRELDVFRDTILIPDSRFAVPQRSPHCIGFPPGDPLSRPGHG